jgi:hypothetical protein
VTQPRERGWQVFWQLLPGGARSGGVVWPRQSPSRRCSRLPAPAQEQGSHPAPRESHVTDNVWKAAAASLSSACSMVLPACRCLPGRRLQPRPGWEASPTGAPHRGTALTSPDEEGGHACMHGRSGDMGAPSGDQQRFDPPPPPPPPAPRAARRRGATMHRTCRSPITSSALATHSSTNNRTPRTHKDGGRSARTLQVSGWVLTLLCTPSHWVKPWHMPSRGRPARGPQGSAPPLLVPGRLIRRQGHASAFKPSRRPVVMDPCTPAA